MKSITLVCYILLATATVTMAEVEEPELKPLYLGCAPFFTDEEGIRQLRIMASFSEHSVDNMSPHKCVQFCSGQGFKYSAYERRNAFSDPSILIEHCWCERYITDLDQLLHNGPCNQPCDDGSPYCSSDPNNYAPLYEADLATEVEHTYVGCARVESETEPSVKGTFSSPLFYIINGTPASCLRWCFAQGFKYSALHAQNTNELECYCTNDEPGQDLLSQDVCTNNCDDPGLTNCPSSFNTFTSVYRTEVPGEGQTTPLILILGGQRLKDPDTIIIGEISNPDSYDCTDIADAPKHTKGMIALNYNDKPMICGGARWDETDTRSCIVYNNVEKTWNEGPELTKRRMYSTVAETNDGVYWVFGGRWGTSAEYFDAQSGKFIEGAKMPIQNTVGPCAATNSDGNIYFVGTDSARTPEAKAKNTQLYDFDPDNKVFGEHKDLPDRLFHMTCHNFDMTDNGYGDLLVVIGGKSFRKVSRNIYVYSSENGEWTTFPDYAPADLLGATSVFVPKSDDNDPDKMLLFGGRKSKDVYALTITSLEMVDGKVNFDVAMEKYAELSKPRMFPVALVSNVENVCKKVNNGN